MDATLRQEVALTLLKFLGSTSRSSRASFAVCQHKYRWNLFNLPIIHQDGPKTFFIFCMWGMKMWHVRTGDVASRPEAGFPLGEGGGVRSPRRCRSTHFSFHSHYGRIH
ncbi:hypothetical protein E2C01_082054 [Portunus trituberculatus]|uniref:Uncharacterized protein n=1 Tax=Portunus trituberculatus TaxID=210409 RepID=A0A5B7J2S5_PORTR|nr:hypothetical protein [Portunus trituberculatus]